MRKLTNEYFRFATKESVTVSTNLSEKALESLAKKCGKKIQKAVDDLGPNLRGYSVLDLVADQIPNASLQNLKAALVYLGYVRYADK